MSARPKGDPGPMFYPFFRIFYSAIRINDSSWLEDNILGLLYTNYVTLFNASCRLIHLGFYVLNFSPTSGELKS